MMKIIVTLFILFASSWSVWAAELRVADDTVTTAVEEQMPVDQVETYPADYGKLYYFTRILGAYEPTEVTHVWQYQGQEMARIVLPVRSVDWRTYSSKRFLPQWTGEWRVLVLDAQGQELADQRFVLE